MVRLLAARRGASLRPERRCSALAVEVVLGGRRLALAVPESYMNESGLAVRALARRHSVEDLAQLVIVHDELDLPVGTVRVKRGGGIAGHNGLRSVQAHLHSLEFVRVRVGVGRPPGRTAGADYVLRRPSRSEAEELATAFEVAADAVESILADGPDAAMNAFNAR